MTTPDDLEIPAIAKPQPDDIVSVNARTAPGGSLFGKIAFLTAVAAVLVVGMAMVLNMAAKGSLKARAADQQTEALRPQSAGTRRKFDVSPASSGATKSPMTPAPSQCTDGQAAIPVRGSDGAPLITNSGPVLVCRDGTVLAAEPAYAEPTPLPSSAPTPAPSTPASVKTGPAANPLPKAPDRYAGDVLLNGGKALPNGPDQPENALIKLAAQLGVGDGAPSPGVDRSPGLSSDLQVLKTAKVRAVKLGDRNMILAKGHTIECGLSVRLVSDLAGQASCVLTQNVYSDNGRVVLLERGSEAVGEYRATLEQGQRRLFVIWTRIKTPNGVVIDLDSPGVDGLGGSGLPGQVDNHWWQRIGSAFLLSTVQDAIAYSASRNAGGDTIVFQNTQSAGRTMADRVLEQSINIRPTLYKNHGDRGMIYVARDLDFGDVYALRRR